MKKLLTISSLFFSSIVLCQNKIDFKLIDQKTRSVETSDAATLAKQLVNGYSTDLEKVRAIFRWITDNISYRMKENVRRPKSKIKDDPDDTSALKPLDERVADDVLENGTAICDGYARLFKTLCMHAGIESEVIHGYARGSVGTRRFGANHSWNVVLIDKKWELMDVTWASGYISSGWSGDRFIHEFDENYFMPSPEKFIQEHYPDNIQWTLMEDPPLMTEFRNSPYKQKTFTKYSIRSYSPAKGLLEVAEGDTLRFELESTNIARDHNIFSDLFPDTSTFKTPSSILLKPSGVLNGRTSYTYHVSSPDIKWIYLLYNDDVILRYRLQVRNEKKDLALSD